MQNNLTFRESTLQDKEQLMKLGTLAYGQYAKIIGPDNWHRLYTNMNNGDTWTGILQVSKGFVCMDDAQMVGMAFLVPSGNPWDIFKEDWSYIRMVGVKPGYEGFGIGRALTEKCIMHARQTHEKTIALHTSEAMHAARHIYESLGFKILKDIEPRLGMKYWIYTLELN